MTDLRSRQRELGRQTIVEACADLVTERHHLDFTMKELAERAGVSLRTVYNHFPTREDLLDELGAVHSARMAARGMHEARDMNELDDLLTAVRDNLDHFEELGGVSEALAQMPLVDVGRDSERRERTSMIVKFIESQMPEAPATDAHAIGVVLRHLVSHRSWFWLTREYGLSTSDAADAITWVVTKLIDAANTGDVPSTAKRSDPMGEQ